MGLVQRLHSSSGIESLFVCVGGGARSLLTEGSARFTEASITAQPRLERRGRLDSRAARTQPPAAPAHALLRLTRQLARRLGAGRLGGRSVGRRQRVAGSSGAVRWRWRRPAGRVAAGRRGVVWALAAVVANSGAEEAHDALNGAGGGGGGAVAALAGRYNSLTTVVAVAAATAATGNSNSQ